MWGHWQGCFAGLFADFFPFDFFFDDEDLSRGFGRDDFNGACDVVYTLCGGVARCWEHVEGTRCTLEAEGMMCMVDEDGNPCVLEDEVGTSCRVVDDAGRI